MKRTPLKRSSGLRRAARARAHSSDAAWEWRCQVYFLCHGRCVMTGQSVPLTASRVIWQAHHVIERGAKAINPLPAELHLEPRLGVILSTRAHERHTNRVERVPFERLPLHVTEFVTDLGDWAIAALLREHPPADNAGPTRARRA